MPARHQAERESAGGAVRRPSASSIASSSSGEGSGRISRFIRLRLKGLPRPDDRNTMRRGLVAVVAVVAAFFAAQPAPAASWAQAQIKVVVANGLMGPSVSNFRAKQNITRKELGEALAAFTGESQVVVDPDAEVS